MNYDNLSKETLINMLEGALKRINQLELKTVCKSSNLPDFGNVVDAFSDRNKHISTKAPSDLFNRLGLHRSEETIRVYNHTNSEKEAKETLSNEEIKVGDTVHIIEGKFKNLAGTVEKVYSNVIDVHFLYNIQKTETVLKEHCEKVN